MLSVCKVFVFLTLTFWYRLEVKGQQWTANHTFAAGETAVYPDASFITNFGGITLIYNAGTRITLQTASTVLFPVAATIFGQNGAESYAANTLYNFENGKIMVLPPGTQMRHTVQTVIRYGGIFGGDVTFVTYVNTATIFFNCPSQPSVFPAGTNSINYYNPGGSTNYGPSPPPLNFATSGTFRIDTQVTGYSIEGWPIRTYRNLGTGEVYRIVQTAQNSARVTRTTIANPLNFLP